MGSCLCNVCWPAYYSTVSLYVCLKRFQLGLVSSHHPHPTPPTVRLPLYVELGSIQLSLGGSGGLALVHWGKAKMAAMSKGMKSVTLGYQCFHSVPCPCWTLLRRRTAALTQELLYDILHTHLNAVLAWLRSIMDVKSLPFFHKEVVSWD